MNEVLTFLDSNVIVGALANLLAIAVLIPLGWDLLRAKFLRAELDGKKIEVDTDEVREAFRRASLAEASRLAGGRKVNLSVEWKGSKLIMKSEK